MAQYLVLLIYLSYQFDSNNKLILTFCLNLFSDSLLSLIVVVSV